MVWKGHSPSVSDLFSQVRYSSPQGTAGSFKMTLLPEKHDVPCFLVFIMNLLETSKCTCTCINMDLLIFLFWDQELDVLDLLTRNICPRPLMEPPIHFSIRIRPSSPDTHDLSKNHNPSFSLETQDISKNLDLTFSLDTQDLRKKFKSFQ